MDILLFFMNFSPPAHLLYTFSACPFIQFQKTFHPARLLEPARLLILLKTSTLPVY